MRTAVTVFYAGLIYGEFDHFPKQHELPNEVYQGGYVHGLRWAIMGSTPWYRCDRTPVLLEDVPKELRTIVLLMS